MKSAAASAGWQAAPAAACHDDSTGESPVLMGSEPGSGFCFDAFSSREGIHFARKRSGRAITSI
jgi:hypothetical protein